MATLIEQTIAAAVQGTRPRTRARMQALAQVRWVLASDDGRFVRIDDSGRMILDRDLSRALVYDGRDNEEMKQRYMEVLLGEPLTVVLLD